MLTVHGHVLHGANAQDDEECRRAHCSNMVAKDKSAKSQGPVRAGEPCNTLFHELQIDVFFGHAGSVLGIKHCSLDAGLERTRQLTHKDHRGFFEA